MFLQFTSRMFEKFMPQHPNRIFIGVGRFIKHGPFRSRAMSHRKDGQIDLLPSIKTLVRTQSIIITCQGEHFMDV